MVTIYTASVLGREPVPAAVHVSLDGDKPLDMDGWDTHAHARLRSVLRGLGVKAKVRVRWEGRIPPTHGADLAVVVGTLTALGRLELLSLRAPEGAVFAVGQLGVGTFAYPARETIATARLAEAEGATLIVPQQQRPEAFLVHSGAHGVADIRNLRRGTWRLTSLPTPKPAPPQPELKMSDVLGNEDAKARAIECVREGRNVLLVGPIGTGKHMIAQRLLGELPPIGQDELREVMTTYCAAGFPVQVGRPFRAPHHTVSASSLRGRWNRPGEIALAHHGILYIDDALTWRTDTREVIRVAAAHGFVRPPSWRVGAEQIQGTVETRPIIIGAITEPAPQCEIRGWASEMRAEVIELEPWQGGRKA